MAGRIAESRMIGRTADGPFSFRAAGPQDAGAVNHLLAATPLGGRLAVSLERAPDPFAAHFGLSDNHLIVIGQERATGRLAGICERTVLPSFVNGKPAALPYIGGLRVAPEFRNRIRLIRGGFAAMRGIGERVGELPFALTSVTADNEPALRLLTAGLKGLPTYRAAGGYSTLFVRAAKCRVDPSIRRAGAGDLPAIATLLNRENSRFQFAPVWLAKMLAGLSSHGLAPQDFLIAGQGAQLTGCIALWDQSARRQAVVRAFPPGLSALRPLWNLAAPLTGMPRLPRLGEPLRHAALTHCAVAGGDEALFLTLIDAARATAARRGLDGAYIGLASDNPLTCTLKSRRSTVEYTTLLHTVHWADREDLDLNASLIAQPEAGLI